MSYQDSVNDLIARMSQFQNGMELPIGYESVILLPGKFTKRVEAKIIASDETRYLVATSAFGKSKIDPYPQAWWIARESAVKNAPSAQLFIFKPTSVEAEWDTEKFSYEVK